MDKSKSSEEDLLLKQPIPKEGTSSTDTDPEHHMREGNEATDGVSISSEAEHDSNTLITGNPAKENGMVTSGEVERVTLPPDDAKEKMSELIALNSAPKLGLEEKGLDGMAENDNVVEQDQPVISEKCPPEESSHKQSAAPSGKDLIKSHDLVTPNDNKDKDDVLEVQQKCSTKNVDASEKTEVKISQTEEDCGAAVKQEVTQSTAADPGDAGKNTPREEEAGSKDGDENGKGSEKKKEEVKKTKQKEGKKSRKGRDSEYMGRTLSQALAGLDTPEEKIAALCKKYAELLGEHKGLQREHKTHQKQLGLLQRDRDHLQSENGRAILAKSKLESLCRELQRHNKTIKEESIQRSKEEDEKRKEVSNKFQQTINEITNQMQDNHTRNIRLKEENLELASKLKKLVEQYERREEHIEKVFKHKEIENQLADAKLQQSNLTLQEEQERFKRERAILLHEAAEAQTKCDLLMKQETQLKAQLAVYTEKFEEFQSTLTKSNEIFQTFKQEMDQMTKKIKKLEKETNMWRVRWENSNKSLLNMAEERTLREKELAHLKNKMMKLENLCRALQAERNALLGKARSKEGAPSSPTKNKKQAIKTACSKSDVPAATVGGVPETSREQSEPIPTVDNKTLVNGDCDHSSGTGGVHDGVGQGVVENAGGGKEEGGGCPQNESNGNQAKEGSEVGTEVKLEPMVVDGFDEEGSGSGGGVPIGTSLPDKLSGPEWTAPGGGESDTKAGPGTSPGKGSGIGGGGGETESTSTATAVIDNVD